jgi:hypothetical protein
MRTLPSDIGAFLQEINAPVGLTFSVSPSVLSWEVSRVTGHLTMVLENWRLPRGTDMAKSQSILARIFDLRKQYLSPRFFSEDLSSLGLGELKFMGVDFYEGHISLKRYFDKSSFSHFSLRQSAIASVRY